jgi:hypothetical protein
MVRLHTGAAENNMLWSFLQNAVIAKVERYQTEKERYQTEKEWGRQDSTQWKID